MKNIYILDTSVLVDNPSSFKTFKDSQVVIPTTVLEELDKLKKLPNEAGKNARVAIKMIDEATKNNIQNIKLPNNITLSLLLDSQENYLSDITYGDNRILNLAKSLNKKNVIVVSNDINLRIKARSLGLKAESYVEQVNSTMGLFLGIKQVYCPSVAIQLLASEKIPASTVPVDLSVNEFVVFMEENEEDIISIGRKTVDDKVKVVKRFFPWGITPRSVEQICAIDLLMDPEVHLVTLLGKAGCGKSLLALAAGLEQCINKKSYQKMSIYRPIQAVGNDIGFLPGPQPLDAKVLTPNGWTTMGELKVGDYVVARDGKPTKVLGIYPKGKKMVYKVSTNDGRSTECCEDHLWLTQTWENKKRGKPGTIKTTKQIIETFYTKKNKLNHYLPRNEAVIYNQNQTLPLDPYVLGVLLGDGCMSFRENSTAVSFASADQEIVDYVNSKLKEYNCKAVNVKNTIEYTISRIDIENNKPAQPIKITNLETNESVIYKSIGKALKEINIKRGCLHSRCLKTSTIDGYKYEFLEKEVRWQNPIKDIIYKLELSNSVSHQKFIPEIYKKASIEERLEILRGLMDTDGTVKLNGETSFTTTSLQLANDVIEIVRSLGGRAKLRSRNRIGKMSKIRNQSLTSRLISYEFNISLPKEMNPFKLSRKASRFDCKAMHAIGIESITPVSEKEVQCILVDNEEHLYITDDFIVTHNTLEEKMMPWNQAIYDNLENLLGSNKPDWKKELEMFVKRGKISIEAMAYIRGRSINNNFMVIDEVQNIKKQDIKTILTRAGHETKIILTGDIEQIDNTNLDALNNGLSHVIEKFKDSSLAGHITLLKGERSLLASEASEIL